MSLPTTHRPSTTGRPRKITDAMIADILRWNATRKIRPLTAAQKAAELGIARATLNVLLKSHGQHYKQPSPEHRHTVQDAANKRRQHLRAGHWL
jgi:hypothetical protein